MLKQRVLTALLLLPIAIAAIFMLPLQGFAITIAVVMVLAAREWGAFVMPGVAPAKVSYGVTIAILLVALLLIVPADQVWVQQQLHPLYQAITIAGALWWLGALALVLSYPGSATMWQHKPMLKALFGQLTIIPCFTAMVALKAWHGQFDGAWLVLAVLLLVWGADTGAYFVGKSIGKTKLIPKVSPGKTREGLAGGMVVCAVLSLVAWKMVPNINLIEALILGMVTGLASALGDLSESMFKRAANIKDSGRLLPGHGGVLDRIDSVTAAMPVFVTLLLLFGA
ncbi:phosphatidate cytidylyltransferase [Ferrimonas lipolytica]|uniref:Phosphatidate cytidylyltransferase n=1 Tax=Ferrimonas lipolytica TaxID=2724191 RepID=A0A6H1UFL2_9GAMM|nr:phosphatidate cytidylyltransferase [Ferrimonas lipolytica]QIZ77390.1 phosphatidate cytidylyltransferase [Ferrimonas lipolytica]